MTTDKLPENMHKRSSRVAATLSLGVFLSLAGCGGSGGDSAPPTVEPPVADNCNIGAIQATLASGPALEGNISVDSVTWNTQGSFTPPGSTTALEKVPDFCRVVASAKPSGDSRINLEVWLPKANWNGKYLSVGEGGLQGFIAFSSLVDGLRRGYATASTDAGHSEADTWWMINHPEKIIDGGFRGKHLQAVAAKAVIRAFYGAAPSRSYHAGCSGGGRQGLMNLQRYPEDYDGYVVGAPANNWTGQIVNWTMKAQIMNDPALAIPAAKQPAIQAAVLAQCDAIDGVKDGIISQPRQCTFNVDAMACAARQDNESCLTAPQVSSLKAVLRGPVDSAGRLLFPGNELGTNIAGAFPDGALSATWNSAFGVPTIGGMVYNRTDWDYRTFNFDTDTKLLESAVAGIYNANNPDLRVQKARGVKVIHYHGLADQAVSPQESINYYERVTAAMGGAAQTRDFYRLFMMPGMGHCTGGIGPNNFGQAGGGALKLTSGAVGPFSPTSTASDDVVKALEKWRF